MIANALTQVGNYLQSRTVLSAVVLGLLLFVPDFKNVVLELIGIISDSASEIAGDKNVMEMLMLISTIYFRVNPQAKF